MGFPSGKGSWRKRKPKTDGSRMFLDFLLCLRGSGGWRRSSSEPSAGAFAKLWVKQQVEQRIQRNGGMMQQMLMMQQQIMQLTGIVNQMTGGQLGEPDAAAPEQQAQPVPQQTKREGGVPGNSREGMAMKAREKAQTATEAR